MELNPYQSPREPDGQLAQLRLSVDTIATSLIATGLLVMATVLLLIAAYENDIVGLGVRE